MTLIKLCSCILNSRGNQSTKYISCIYFVNLGVAPPSDVAPGAWVPDVTLTMILAYQEITLNVTMRLPPKEFHFEKYRVKIYNKTKNGDQYLGQVDRYVHNKCSQCPYEIEVRVTVKFIENNIILL